MSRAVHPVVPAAVGAAVAVVVAQERIASKVMKKIVVKKEAKQLWNRRLLSHSRMKISIPKSSEHC